MKYFKYSSANLFFSSLLVISSLLYSQDGQAMDKEEEDPWSDSYFDAYIASATDTNVPENQSQQTPTNSTASYEKESATGGEKRLRDSDEESEDRSSKRQRTEEGHGSFGENNFPSSSAAYQHLDRQSPAPFASSSSSSACLNQDSVASLLAEGDRLKKQGSNPADYNQALRCYKTAASQGSLEAYAKAAHMYVMEFHSFGDDDSSSENDPESNDYLEIAMTYLKNAGPEIVKISLNEREVFWIIDEYIKHIPEEKIDFQTLINFCQSYSSESVPNIILGTLYVCGKGVEKDEDKALEYFKNADKLMCEEQKTTKSKLGHIFYQVGAALSRDLGTNNSYLEPSYAVLKKFSDREKAIKFLKKAVDHKDIRACMKLIDLSFTDSQHITLTDLKKARDCLDMVAYQPGDIDNFINTYFSYEWNNGSVTGDETGETFPLFNTLRRFYAFPSPFYDPERSEKFMKLAAKAGNEECIRLCAGQSNVLKSLKYIAYSSRLEAYKYIIYKIFLFMNRMAEAADADLLDSKQLYDLGKMHSYIVRNKRSDLSFLHELPQDDGDEAKDRVIAQQYNLGMKYLLQAVKKSQNGPLIHPGKPYLELAKLIFARRDPMDLDKGIEYGEKARKDGLDKALHLCGHLYILKQQLQMAGSYFFRGFTKGVSRARRVLHFFEFEKSTSSGTHSSHVLPVFDHNDPFDGKIQDLLLLCGEQYHIHTDEPFFSGSSGVTVSLSSRKKKTDELGPDQLGPLYKKLHNFGQNLTESARDLLEAESSHVGLLVPNVKPARCWQTTPDTLERHAPDPDKLVPVFTYSDEGEAAQKGFRIVKVKDQELSCLGEDNPERGTKFHKLITTWKDEAHQAIVSINNVYTKKLSVENLETTERAQLVEEQQKLPALTQAIDDGVDVLEKIAYARAPARAEAMEREYGPLFKH